MTEAQVVHVITDTDRRGAQIFASDLTSALASRGRAVALVALEDGSDAEGLPVPWLGKRAFGVTTLKELRRAVRSARVVVAHGSKTLPATVVATAGTDATLIYRSIGDPLYWGRTPVRRLRMRLLLRRVSVVVALWPGAAASLVERFGVPPNRVRTISNAVPAERFPIISSAQRAVARRRFGLEEDAWAAVYLGALTAEKNVGAAIRALGLLPNARLLIVGRGSERPKLELQARRFAPGRVRFVEPTDRPADALAAGDAVVLPSLTEGVPAVIIEAGLAGVPVIATSVGGVGEVVIDGETGRLVPPDDHVALAEALRSTFMRDGCKASREWCLSRFDIGVAAAAWDDLLAEFGAWSVLL